MKTPLITLVVPTLNEVGNISPLIERLDQALASVPRRLLFVDDASEDGTFDAIGAIAAKRSDIQAIRRVGRRGLSSACIEGLTSASTPIVAVMDADLQHDERLLPSMLTRLQQERLDLVVASRFARGGSVGSLSWQRSAMSRTANILAARLCGLELSDAMSGFFMLRRCLFQTASPHLAGQGTKILLDLLTSCPKPLRVGEIPLCFRERHSGESKLDAQVMIEFTRLFTHKAMRRLRLGAPARHALMP